MYIHLACCEPIALAGAAVHVLAPDETIIEGQKYFMSLGLGLVAVAAGELIVVLGGDV
jgi:hypothetical protein